MYRKDIKNYVKNISRGFDILITSRIDYDDRIYYDAVNDVRKVINIDRPIQLHGYNRGFIYYEQIKKYFKFYKTFGNKGVMSIFASLIIVLNKVNDTYTIIDVGPHLSLRDEIINNYKKYGLHKLDYEPAIFDSGAPKIVYVRQKYSGTYNSSNPIRKNLKSVYFNLNKFYGFDILNKI